MKFQKLDQKQVPQVVILGVITVGILGWAGYQWIGAASSARAETNPPAAARMAQADKGAAHSATGEPTATGQPDAGTAAGGPAPAGAGAVGLGVGGYNPDPFRAPANVEQPAKVTPAPAPKPAQHEQPSARWPGNPGALPNPGGEGGATLPAGPVEPPAPVRPTVVVTGIIDVDGGHDMALLEMNSQQRIVQVGDEVDSYKVKKIDLNGVLLVNGKDRYYAGLASTEKAEGKS